MGFREWVQVQSKLGMIQGIPKMYDRQRRNDDHTTKGLVTYGAFLHQYFVSFIIDAHRLVVVNPNNGDFESNSPMIMKASRA